MTCQYQRPLFLRAAARQPAHGKTKTAGAGNAKAPRPPFPLPPPLPPPLPRPPRPRSRACYPASMFRSVSATGPGRAG
ncbi:hypothetical protein BC938DRAFT_476710, partial [Jimgerdemannia flammicorona]